MLEYGLEICPAGARVLAELGVGAEGRRRVEAAEYWPPSGVSYRVHGGCIDRVMW